MDQNTEDLLLSAWREKRLAAVHIDIETMYEYNNQPTFQSVGRFAQRLRDWNIPNVWVTFPKIIRKVELLPGTTYRNMSPAITTVAAFNARACAPDHSRDSMIVEYVNALPDETVIVKDRGSAFHEKVKSFLDIFLRRNSIDTVIIDGVDFEACIGKTLNDGTALNRYDFISSSDCINIRCEETYKDYLLQKGDIGLNGIRRPIRDVSAFHRRFHEATSVSIIESFESQQRKAAMLYTPLVAKLLTKTDVSILGISPTVIDVPPLPVAVMSQENLASQDSPPAP